MDFDQGNTDLPYVSEINIFQYNSIISKKLFET